MLVKMPPGIVGNRIQEMCQDRGWTISQLSREAEISLPTARNLWYGHAKGAEWVTMGKIARAFGVELGDVFQLIPNGNDNSDP